MKKLLAIILLVASTAFAQSPPTIAKARQSLVTLSMNEPENGMVQINCTGFQIGINQVLTVAHCVPENGEIWLNGKKARVAKRNGHMVLLNVELPPVVLTIRKGAILVGEDVAAIGYAYGAVPDGVLKRSVARLDDNQVFLDGPVIGGMSGGPIVGVDGAVVGITQATNALTAAGCDAGEIRAFLGIK